MFFWTVVIVIQTEVLSYLLTKVQFLVPLMIVACREFDHRIRLKIVDKMIGDKDEKAIALVDVTVSALYGSFVAIKLPEVDFSTVCFIVGLELILHLIMAYQVLTEQQKISAEHVDDIQTSTAILCSVGT